CLALLRFAATAEQHTAGRAPESAQRTECRAHCRRLISAMDHAIAAAGIPAGATIVGPIRRIDQFLEGLRVTFVEQVARLLPAENVVGRIAPGRAFELPIALQELQKQR